MKPKITVLMAVYNGAAYLRRCMDSTLGQAYKDFEFLIVDDGSTDATVDIIKSYGDSRIRLLENRKNLSQVTSLNIGLDNAQGEYIARIDADDIMLPGRLKKQADFLDKNPQVALSGAFAEAVNEREERIAIARLPVRNEEIIANILFGGFILVHSSMMFRKNAVLDAGKYNEAFSFTEDYKLATDLLIKGYKINNMPEALVKYRIHDDRISVRDAKPQHEKYLKVINEFIKNFTKTFSESDRALVCDFLINAGSLNRNYMESKLEEKDVKKIIGLSDILLFKIMDYFKFSLLERYFFKKIIYNKFLNFAYQASKLGKKGLVVYLYCLKHSGFLLTKPKLYLYPLKSFI